jgi:hypothetical protein
VPVVTRRVLDDLVLAQNTDNGPSVTFIVRVIVVALATPSEEYLSSVNVRFASRRQVEVDFAMQIKLNGLEQDGVL